MSAFKRFMRRWWWNRVADTAVLFRRQRAASHAYRQLLQIDERDQFALACLGSLLAEAGDATGAIAEFERLVQINPKHAEGWFNLGFLLEQADDLPNAERCFREAIALRPSIDRAWYGLGLTLIRAGRLGEAVEAFRKNIELQPFSPYGFYQLAMTYHHLGDSGHAWRIHEQLARFEPSTRRPSSATSSARPRRRRAGPEPVFRPQPR